MDVTKGHGADIILETGGAETILKSFQCAAYGGLINCIGYTSGKGSTTGDQTEYQSFDSEQDSHSEGDHQRPD